MNNKLYTYLIKFLLIVSVLFVLINCKKGAFSTLKINPKSNEVFYTIIPFDSTEIKTFFENYPDLKKYQKEVYQVYQKHHYEYIWYTKSGKKETADVLHDRLNNIDKDGIQVKIPYKETFEKLFIEGFQKPNLQTELFLTSYYFFYADKVFHGIDVSKSTELGWYLPRKKSLYSNYLDSLLLSTSKMQISDPIHPQYFKLREALAFYRKLEKENKWENLEVPNDFKALKYGDSADFVLQMRKNLVTLRTLNQDSKSKVFDESLLKAMLKFKKHTGFKEDTLIQKKHIVELNIAPKDRVKTIIVNMERARWISPDVRKSKEYIVVNIPSYRLMYFKNGKIDLVSNVVVGTALNKTVVFSGELSTVVFSPYWNVPNSILRKEILPAIRRNKRYLANHRMEWHNGGVRQKPGPNNALGLVKFLFPNSNNIYLHDTPSKSLFTEEKRAFSHGCIRVQKPKELAYKILEENPEWPIAKIDSAMHKGKETWVKLKNTVPVYIGYFTVWIDNDGNVNFYKDVYNRDEKLAELLIVD